MQITPELINELNEIKALLSILADISRSISAIRGSLETPQPGLTWFKEVDS